MRPYRLTATGTSALLVLLFVTASANAQNIPRCRDILGGALAVLEIKKNSTGANVYMARNFRLPSYSVQEILGQNGSDSREAAQSSSLIIGKRTGHIANLPNFGSPIRQSFFKGKANLTWKKFVNAPWRNLLSRIKVAYRLLHNGKGSSGSNTRRRHRSNSAPHRTSHPSCSPL